MNSMGRAKKEVLNSARQARRKFLEDAGKIGVYAPPALVLLLHPGAEAIASGTGRRRRRRRIRYWSRTMRRWMYRNVWYYE